jgi:hypothetical protein
MPVLTVKVRKLKKKLNPDIERVKKRTVQSISDDKTFVSTITDQLQETEQTQVLEKPSIESNDVNMTVVFPSSVIQSLILNAPSNLITDLKLAALQEIDKTRFDAVAYQLEEIKKIGSLIDKDGFVTNKVVTVVKNYFNNSFNSSPKIQLQLNSFLSLKLNKYLPKCEILILDNTATEVCGKSEFSVRQQVSQDALILFDNLSVVAMGGDSLDNTAPGLSSGEFFKAFLLFERYYPLTLTFTGGASSGQFANLGISTVQTAVSGAPQLKI